MPDSSSDSFTDSAFGDDIVSVSSTVALAGDGCSVDKPSDRWSHLVLTSKYDGGSGTDRILCTFIPMVTTSHRRNRPCSSRLGTRSTCCFGDPTAWIPRRTRSGCPSFWNQSGRRYQTSARTRRPVAPLRVWRQMPSSTFECRQLRSRLRLMSNERIVPISAKVATAPTHQIRPDPTMLRAATGGVGLTGRNAEPLAGRVPMLCLHGLSCDIYASGRVQAAECSGRHTDWRD